MQDLSEDIDAALAVMMEVDQISASCSVHGLQSSIRFIDSV